MNQRPANLHHTPTLALTNSSMEGSFGPLGSAGGAAAAAAAFSAFSASTLAITYLGVWKKGGLLTVRLGG